MKNLKKLCYTLMLIFTFNILFLALPNKIVHADNLKEVYIRVEGLDKTLAEGSEKANTAYEALENILKKNNIKYDFKDSQYGKYMESIGGIKGGTFGGWDGWLYYIKNAGNVEAATTSIDNYVLKQGDNIIVYYGNFDTPYVNDITFEPNIVKENQSFKMKFSFKSFDFTANKEVIYPIKNAIVNIDEKSYTTDDKGYITVEALVKGEHTYKISGYDKGKISKVIMDKGTFIIDNEKAPSIYYNDKKYNENNNLNIVKNIEKELEITTAYVKNNISDPWAQISLNKLGLKGKEDFLSKWITELDNKSIKDLYASELVTKIMGLVSSGYSPYNFNGHNLVEELLNRNIEDFYYNEIVFALFVYNYANIQGDYKISEAKLVNELLKNKLSYEVEGKRIEGWTWFGDKIDPDMTAAAINALSPYYNGKKVQGVDNSKVKEAVDSAVKTLSFMQSENGDIIGQYGLASETDAFVIIGLVSVGVDPQGDLFTKAKGDLVSALLSYKGNSGMFNHDKTILNNPIATEQALRALVSLKEFKNTGVYNYYASNIDAKALPNYIVENKDNKEDKTEPTKILPETGSNINMNSLTGAAIISIVLGTVLLLKRNK